jgi:hypothetical protein
MYKEAYPKEGADPEKASVASVDPEYSKRQLAKDWKEMLNLTS